MLEMITTNILCFHLILPCSSKLFYLNECKLWKITLQVKSWAKIVSLKIVHMEKETITNMLINVTYNHSLKLTIKYVIIYKLSVPNCGFESGVVSKHVIRYSE